MRRVKISGVAARFVHAAAGGALFALFLTHPARPAISPADPFSHLLRPPIYWYLILQQMLRIGYFSLPVVGLTAFFTGAVLCLQIFIGGNRYGAEAFMPQIMVLGMTRAPGPAIPRLMVAGARCSAMSP